MYGWIPLCVLLLVSPVVAFEEVRFNRDVRPLLADRCFTCHGPDQNKRKSRLRLDRSEGIEGAYRERYGSYALRPGIPEQSELWYRVSTDDLDDRMPPADSHKQPLTAEEQDLLRRWIEQGAVYEEHWSFTAPVPPAVSALDAQGWGTRPLDSFVLRRLDALGREPSARADERTLIRRVSLDITGLPPTRAEIEAFLGAASSDPGGAYERLVGRLLCQPQYGEHMAKYWLDLVRFADTNGIHHDHYRELSPYRDWVIRAWNENLAYDDFATYQLAGDLYPEPSEDQQIASGFNRLHMIIDVGTALPEESHARNVLDRVTAVGTAFMGLTVGCAVCHDHKYDPFTQRDFYQLGAFFNNLDAAAETGSGESDKQRGLQPPYINLPTTEQRAALDELVREVAVVQGRVDELTFVSSKEADETAKQALDAELGQSTQELGEWKQQRDQLLSRIPAAMVMKEREEVRPAHILIRGAYDNPGELVERDTPAFLPPSQAEGDVKTRMDLARWLVTPEHPLTARVFVNRLWQQFFGVGLVKTSEDFGTQGEWPSHIELLDHLSVSFVESGWDVKALVREIVLSATYCQSSLAPRQEFERDPDNRLLARGPRFRMDAEMIRDQILATSGLLNTTMYGKSVKPPQPDGLWDAVVLPSSFPRSYEPDSGDKIVRRSLYTYWKRAMPPPQMSILNAPTRESCTVRRPRSNTPLQALLLLNESEYLRAARHLAAQTLASDKSLPEDRLSVVYETITSRLPDAVERETLLELVRDLEAMYSSNAELAAQLCEGATLKAGRSAAELAAWTMLVSTIYNLDIVKTRE
jgi:hypothetical protein